MWFKGSVNLIQSFQLSGFLTWMLPFQTMAMAFILWFLYTQVFKIYFSPLRKIPSTNFFPIVGCLPSVINMGICTYMEMWFHKLKSPIYRYFWLLGQSKIVVADADLAKHILINKVKIYPKSREGYHLLKSLLGEGLVTAGGNLHRRNRKLCNGSFKISVLKNIVPVFDKSIKDLIDMWLTEISNRKDGYDEKSFTEIPMHKELTNFTLDVIGKFAFEYDFNAIQHCDSEATRNFRNLFEMYEITWDLVVFILFPSLNTKYAEQHRKHIENANDIVYAVIKKKREELSEKPDESQATSLLASLLMAKDEETGAKMDDEQIRDEVMTFMLAGHETTGVTLCWCLLEAARHPEMQQKIRDELDSVITPGTLLSFDDVEKLTYTKCFIQEILRMYPAAPVVAREASENNYLGGYLIPKGTNIDINVNLIHRNPKYWDEPLEFRPERFFDTSTFYPYSFLPFIGGSRMCIGYKFAILEMTTALARLVNKFQFETIPNITYKRIQKLTSRPSPSLVLRVREIN